MAPSFPIPVADQAVAQVALTSLLEYIAGSAATDELAAGDGSGVAEWLVRSASKVRFQPSTRQLVLTFDLDMSGEQSTGGSVTPIQ